MAQRKRRGNPGGAGWRAKGFRDGLNNKSGDAPAAFKKYAKQLPDDPRMGFAQFKLVGKVVGLGTYVTAQENYYVGFQRGQEAKSKAIRPRPERNKRKANGKYTAYSIMGATGGQRGSYGFLATAKKAAQTLANSSGKSVVVLASDSRKTWHVYPKKKKPNPKRRKRTGRASTSALIPAKVQVVNGGRSLRVLVSKAVARRLNPGVRQTSCKFCELDIENFAPYRKCEWRDRGNNTKCHTGPNAGKCHVPYKG